jgi:hypothetical protein
MDQKQVTGKWLLWSPDEGKPKVVDEMPEEDMKNLTQEDFNNMSFTFDPPHPDPVDELEKAEGYTLVFKEKK